MTKKLPRSPRMEHLRKEAKSILKSHKKGDSACLSILKNLHHLKNETDEKIFQAEVNLHDVQFALAMEYGFETWADMEHHVKNEAAFPDNDSEQPAPIKPQIDWVPPGKPSWHPEWMNGYVRGLELILSHEGISTDYDTLMGDIGQAFIMQGEEHSDNKIRGNIDLGWWPIEVLGFIRLNFIEKTVGRTISDIKLSAGEYNSDPDKTYSEKFEPVIQESLNKGMPCIAVRIDDAEFIITGCDNDRHPLIGMCTNTNEGEVKIDRIKAPVPPYALLTIGKNLPNIDRKAADKEALAFAIELHNDKVLGPGLNYKGQYSLRRAGEFKKTWRTGIKSFQSWIAELELEDYSGPGFWHANVRSFLINNRKTAVRYLEKMSKRHSGSIAKHIDKAIKHYQSVVAKAGELNVSDESIHSKEKRVEMVEIIKSIIDFESDAISEISNALNLMK